MEGGVGDIIDRRVRSDVEFRLVHLLIPTKFQKLATEDSALFDNFGREITGVVFCNGRPEFQSVGPSESRIDNRKKYLLAAFKV